jgi:hypothetical protein
VPNGSGWDDIEFERLMLTMTGAVLQIDTSHTRAICDEIGDRLRGFLRCQANNELPLRLRDLMEQLARIDDVPSPSIAPSLDEMLSPENPIATSS